MSRREMELAASIIKKLEEITGCESTHILFLEILVQH
jgi:hypothetical protein